MSRYIGLKGTNVDILTTKWRLDKEWISNLPTGKGFFLTALHCRYLFPFGARKWLNKNILNYDVIHISKNWSLLASLAAYAAVRNNVPYVFSAMGFVAVHNRSKLLKYFYRKYITIPIIRYASACIAVTKEERLDLINAGATPEKVYLIPNGIIPENLLHKDDEGFRNRFTLNNRKIILFIGRMDPIKGVHLLIDAFNINRNLLIDWSLVLIGTQSAYRKDMERKVKESGLQDNILFIDPLFGKAKSEAYHAAEFVVVPSIKDAMTIIAPEAACCAKPVLITNTADFSELALCGGAIEVTPSIEGIADGLAFLADDSCDRIAMGKKGYDFVINNFAWDIMAVKYMDLFNSVSRLSQTNSITRNAKL